MLRIYYFSIIKYIKKKRIMKFDLSHLGIEKGSRVIVAMSGGVDSSVTALMAKESGLIPIGITMQMFDNKNEFWKDAEHMANFLDIEWHLADYTEEFIPEIIGYFIREYKNGKTPNPCSRCNKLAKTRYLHHEMQKYNCKYILTGHYAKTKEVNGQYHIQKAFYAEKDQSYYLSMVEPYFVNILKFPLGDMIKPDVRKIAEQYSLPVATKKDSQEACFLENKDYREFLEPYKKNWKKGNIILNDKIIGPNKGIENYTPGQRRGLEVSYSEPLYVKNIDSSTGDVYLGTKDEVYRKGVALKDAFFYPDTPYMGKFTAKLRYRMKDEPCLVERQPDNKCKLLFDDLQFAPAPGQTAAIYDGDIIIGSGIIDYVF